MVLPAGPVHGRARHAPGRAAQGFATAATREPVGRGGKESHPGSAGRMRRAGGHGGKEARHLAQHHV